MSRASVVWCLSWQRTKVSRCWGGGGGVLSGFFRLAHGSSNPTWWVQGQRLRWTDAFKQENRGGGARMDEKGLYPHGLCVEK